MNVQVKYAYQDLLTTPDDGNRYEIFEGELVMTPAPGTVHQRIVFKLCNILGNYLKQMSSGEVYPAPVDVYFNEETTVQPDLIFVSRDRLHIIDEQKVNGAPDVVVEIISESTESRDRSFKFKLYAKEGVREYWIVDPAKKTVEVYELKETGFMLAGKFGGKDEFKSPYFVDLKFTANHIFE